MSILLLFAAIVCWLAAAAPGVITIAVGRVDWGWLGMAFFGIWILVGPGDVLARFRRTAP